MIPDVKMPMIHCEKCGEYHSTFYRCTKSVASAPAVTAVPNENLPTLLEKLLTELADYQDRLAALERWRAEMDGGK